MSRSHVVTSAELQSLRDLELVTKATVEGLRQGLHRSPFHGYSAEFSQYRHYRPGDDLKYVDWKLFARTDRVYTRQFRETTNLAALTVLDASRSMHFPIDSPDSASGLRLAQLKPLPTKFALARSVAAVLGTLILDQGDAAGVLAAGEQTHYLPPRSGHHHLRALVGELTRVAPAGDTPIEELLRRAAALMKRRGLLIVVSDFYEDEGALTQIRRLRRIGHDVIAVQVLSRPELSLDVGSAAEFVDLESGRKLVVQPSSAREIYSRKVMAWLASLEAQLRRDGVDYLRVMTGEPLEPALRRFLIARREAGA